MDAAPSTPLSYQSSQSGANLVDRRSDGGGKIRGANAQVAPVKLRLPASQVCQDFPVCQSPGAMTMPEEERELFAGRRFRVVQRIQLSSGGRSLPREVILHPGAVVVVPLAPADQVCLIRNERIAVGKTLIELPAGTMEPPTPPLEMAIRELQEETGY
ncbi:MAG TPA: NUDIX hydrolase, partial [Lacipirellulaceae bacterium]|nr:NUDIX hydrolase [Lacipirellulaceae bacterium]